jgi:hypothetical protein
MKRASLPREPGAAPQPRKANQPPPGGFFYGESMTDFSTALTRLWPHGDEKIPGLRAGMIASAPAVFARSCGLSDLVAEENHAFIVVRLRQSSPEPKPFKRRAPAKAQPSFQGKCQKL